MQSVRRIQKAYSEHISLKIPKSFIQRSLEIIIMPVDDAKPMSEALAVWPKGFFSRTAGCFADAPIVREDQGECPDIAKVNELVLVTHNTREFSRVSGLQLDDWEQSRQ